MPRKSRIDAPGALHHIIVRGIERREGFVDDTDRDNFLVRIGAIITETKTGCYAWAIIPTISTSCQEPAKSALFLKDFPWVFLQEGGSDYHQAVHIDKGAIPFGC